MKHLTLLVACSAVLAFGQPNKAADQIQVTARSIVREGILSILRGHVELATKAFVLSADEVDFHRDIGEAEARGNVRLKLLDAITGDKLADNNMSVQAVSLSREQSVYRLRGHAEISTYRISLRADEIDYHEDTAQAEARGNVRIKWLGR